jgi:hypothetical protein
VGAAGHASSPKDGPPRNRPAFTAPDPRPDGSPHLGWTFLTLAADGAAALSWGRRRGSPGDRPPATHPRAAGRHRRPARRPPGLAARARLRRHRQDHRPPASGRGRPRARPLPRLQQGHPARGPGALPRPRRLPHRPQPRLPRNPDGRATGPPRAQAHGPRRGRDVRHPGPGRPAPGVLGPLRDRDRAGLHPTAPRARSTGSTCRPCPGAPTVPNPCSPGHGGSGP